MAIIIVQVGHITDVAKKLPLHRRGQVKSLSDPHVQQKKIVKPALSTIILELMGSIRE